MRRALVLALAVAACTPSAPPPGHVAPPPPATVAPPALPSDWRDLPETAGTWTYASGATGSSANFGLPGAAPVFTVACRKAERRVALVRAGGQAGTMTVTTSYAPARLPAAAEAGGAAVLLAASDPFLDRLAFSRGRFEVELPGSPRLVLPAWAEPARVIEDCRG